MSTLAGDVARAARDPGVSDPGGDLARQLEVLQGLGRLAECPQRLALTHAHLCDGPRLHGVQHSAAASMRGSTCAGIAEQAGRVRPVGGQQRDPTRVAGALRHLGPERHVAQGALLVAGLVGEQRHSGHRDRFEGERGLPRHGERTLERLPALREKAAAHPVVGLAAGEPQGGRPVSGGNGVGERELEVGRGEVEQRPGDRRLVAAEFESLLVDDLGEPAAVAGAPLVGGDSRFGHAEREGSFGRRP